MDSFGLRPQDESDPTALEPAGLPIVFVDTLPAAGDFPGQLFDQKSGTPGLYRWTGSVFVLIGAAGGGGGDMTKAVYDADNDTIVDRAEQLEGPTLGANITTAAQVRTHLDSVANPHATTATQVGAPPTTRAINTTLPIAGGGDLSADRTISFSNFSGASRLFGAGSAGASPAEITLGTNLAMAGTVLNASGGGTTPTGTGFRHVTAGVEDAAAKLVDTADVNADQITNALLANMTDGTLKGRALGAGSGDPTDLTPAQGRTLLNVADGANNYTHPNHTGDVTSVGHGAQTIANDAVTNAKLANMAARSVKCKPTTGTGDPTDLGLGLQSLMGRQGGDLVSIGPLTASQWVGRPAAATQLDGQTMRTMAVELVAELAGTNFPISPVEGELHYRTDHRTLYAWNPGISRWIGQTTHEIEGGDTGAMAISTYYREYTLGAAGTRYSATYGRQFGFDVVCVGMTILSAITPAVSARAVVTDDGTAVTGASVTLTTPATSAQDETLLSSVIAAGSIIGLQNDAVGATLGLTKVIARFRRVAT